MPNNFYEKIIIVDTSCLIAFDNINRFDILRAICPSIFTTPEVAFEYIKPLPEWVRIIEVKDRIKIKHIHSFLGLGEASAIALALETENSLIILDDKKARQYAQNMELSFTGIVGLLRIGYKQGVIMDVDSIIDSLQKIDFRLPANIRDLIKR
jgi:predicted nucleic acid-binding protein